MQNSLIRRLTFILLIITNLVCALEISDSSGRVLTRSASTTYSNQLLYLSSADLKALFPAGNPYLFKIDEQPVLFADSSVFCAIGKKIYNLSYPSLTIKGEIYFPLERFIAIFNQATNKKLLQFDGNLLQINEKVITRQEPVAQPPTVKPAKPAVTDNRFNIREITVAEKKNGTAITLHTARAFKTGEISSSQTKDNSFYLTVYKGTVNLELIDSIPLTGVVKKISAAQQKQSLQLTFDLKREILSRSILIQKNKIIITLITEKTAEIPNEAIIKKLQSEKERWEIDNIIIDAGHGGKDPGAIGKSGTYEKDITLNIARYLKELLQNDGSFKTYLTRSDDRFIELKERGKIANSHNGKLFVSIHCNANKSSKHSGFETYFLKPARTEKALEVAALENSVIKYEADRDDYKELTDHEYIILSMMQANFAKESESWASSVQKRIAEFSSFKDRGVDQAGFYVLVGASMPAILVECGFISNPQEEKSLKKTSYQKQLAESIYKSILDLKKKIEKNE